MEKPYFPCYHRPNIDRTNFRSDQMAIFVIDKKSIEKRLSYVVLSVFQSPTPFLPSTKLSPPEPWN